MFWVDVKQNATLQQPNPRDQERANRPCVALHVKKQPQIQWSCETEVCFLHIQLMRPNVRLLTIHKILPEVDIESSRSPARSESCNTPVLCCISHMTVLSVVTRAVNVGNRTSQPSVTSSCPFCDCSFHFLYLTKEYLVFHCVTCTSISRGFESRPLINALTVCNSSF